MQHPPDLVQQRHGEGERAEVVGGHDHLVAVRGVHPLAALVHEDAGVVDEEVDLLKLGVDVLGEAADVPLGGEVQPQGVHRGVPREPDDPLDSILALALKL